MPKNTFIALFIAYGSGLAGGLISLLLASIFLQGNFQRSAGDSFISSREVGSVVGIVIDFILPFFVCVIVLLPLAAADKKKIEESTFRELLIRYLPVITIPIGLLFCFPLLTDFKDQNDRFEIMTILFTVYGICCSCLWSFLRKLKSRP